MGDSCHPTLDPRYLGSLLTVIPSGSVAKQFLSIDPSGKSYAPVTGTGILPGHRPPLPPVAGIEQ
jgi:hypothetical protein